MKMKIIDWGGGYTNIVINRRKFDLFKKKKKKELTNKLGNYIDLC